MRLLTLPVVLLLVFSKLQLGTSLSLPVQGGLSSRSEFGDVNVDEGAGATHDGSGKMSGGGKKWATEHPGEKLGKEDTVGQGNGAEGGGEGSNAPVQKAADGNEIAADGNEIFQVGKVKAEFNKGDGSAETDCAETCTALRRRLRIFPSEGSCFPNAPKEVVEYNKAWVAFDKSAEKMTQAQVKWVDSEITSRIGALDKDQMKLAIENGDISFSQLDVKPNNPDFLTLSITTFKDINSAGLKVFDVSPIKLKNVADDSPATFGPESPKLLEDSKADYSLATFAELPESPGLKRAPDALKDLSGADIVKVYKEQMDRIRNDPKKTIQDQIDLQKVWQDRIRMQNPQDSIAAKTNTVEVGAKVAQARKKIDAKVAGDPKYSFWIMINDVTYRIDAPEELPESWWKEEDPVANFESPEGKEYMDAWNSYIDHKGDWQTKGLNAETAVEKRGGLQSGLLKNLFGKISDYKANAAAAGEEVDPNVMVGGMRIQTNGNKILVEGIPLTTPQKIGLGVGITAGFIGGGALVGSQN